VRSRGVPPGLCARKLDLIVELVEEYGLATTHQASNGETLPVS
jgi:hypothetical protein